MSEPEYIILEVKCMVCGTDLKPNTCEFELWRIGYSVCKESISPSCVAALDLRLNHPDARENAYT